MAGLLAVCLLRVFAHHDFALKNTTGMVIHHALEKFAAGAMGLLVVDHKPCISVLFAAKHERPGDFGIDILTLEFYGAVLAV